MTTGKLSSEHCTFVFLFSMDFTIAQCTPGAEPFETPQKWISKQTSYYTRAE